MTWVHAQWVQGSIYPWICREGTHNLAIQTWIYWDKNIIVPKFSQLLVQISFVGTLGLSESTSFLCQIYDVETPRKSELFICVYRQNENSRESFHSYTKIQRNVTSFQTSIFEFRARKYSKQDYANSHLK